MQKDLINISKVADTYYRDKLYAIDVNFNYNFYKADFKGEIRIETDKVLSDEEIKDKIIEVLQ